jgi:hypothetical protein
LRGKLGNLTALDGEQEIPLNQQAIQAFNTLKGPLKLLCAAYVDPDKVSTRSLRRVLGIRPVQCTSRVSGIAKPRKIAGLTPEHFRQQAKPLAPEDLRPLREASGVSPGREMLATAPLATGSAT